MTSFNPRARTGRDTGCHTFARRQFQSTRPYGARRRAAVRRRYAARFQSTRPYGARPACGSPHGWTMFQSTRPYGARRMRCRTCHVCSFNPRARTGRDGSGLSQTSVRFNPRARTGRDVRVNSCDSISRFNPRARTGRDVPLTTAGSDQTFQSTRPYGARRWAEIVRHRIDVSIHAPVRGATSFTVQTRVQVSIHAPVRGATCNGADART